MSWGLILVRITFTACGDDRIDSGVVILVNSFFNNIFRSRREHMWWVSIGGGYALLKRFCYTQINVYIYIVLVTIALYNIYICLNHDMHF